jgi:hypothetical protein
MLSVRVGLSPILKKFAVRQEGVISICPMESCYSHSARRCTNKPTLVLLLPCRLNGRAQRCENKCFSLGREGRSLHTCRVLSTWSQRPEREIFLRKPFPALSLAPYLWEDLREVPPGIPQPDIACPISSRFRAARADPYPKKQVLRATAMCRRRIHGLFDWAPEGS